jgi:hypothetical protein
MEEKFGEKLERIMSELKKMTLAVKHPSKKHPSDQQAFVEALIEWVAVKSISFRSTNHRVFRGMVRCANPDFSVPVYNTLKPHIKRLADAFRQLPTHQDKCYCSLMVDGANSRPRGFGLVAGVTGKPTASHSHLQYRIQFRLHHRILIHIHREIHVQIHVYSCLCPPSYSTSSSLNSLLQFHLGLDCDERLRLPLLLPIHLYIVIQVKQIHNVLFIIHAHVLIPLLFHCSAHPPAFNNASAVWSPNC